MIVGGGHARQVARSARALQGLCAAAALAAAAGLACGAGGCARVPPPRGEGAIRALLFERADAGGGTARGEGAISFTRHGERLGSAEVRWVSVAESVAVVGSVGPVRLLIASLRGDSLLVDFRRSDLAVAGALRDIGTADGALARFLLEPWRFGAPPLRDALARAAWEPAADGHRVSGTLDGDSAGTRRFVLVIDGDGEPRSLSLSLGPGRGDTVHVRYGGLRRYAAGRIPRWVEWSWAGSRARLTIDRHAAWSGGPPRTDIRPEPDDTLVTLDSSRGRGILRRFLGLDPRESGP